MKTEKVNILLLVLFNTMKQSIIHYFVLYVPNLISGNTGCGLLAKNVIQRTVHSACDGSHRKMD